jgi:sodium bicarbonate transporter 10
MTFILLLFMRIIYSFRWRERDYLSFRWWIGMWIAAILLIFVAVDASILVCYITRFTEENFATLIAFIFIYKVSIHGAAFTALITVCIVS